MSEPRREDEREMEPSKEAIETTDENGWLHRRCEGEVPENSKVIGGVLCRYWYEEPPEGVALLNSIHAHQQAMQALEDENGKLKAILTTPEVYVGVVTEECEKHWAALIEAKHKAMQAAQEEIARLANRCNQLERLVGKIAMLLREDMTNG